MRAGVVEVWIAARSHVDHRRHIKLAQFFVDRIPVAIDQRRIGPVTARWIGIQVHADKAEFIDDPLQLRNTVLRRDTGKLRQLPDADEIIRQQHAQAMNDVIADRGPLLAHRLGADVMRHAGRARRKDRQVTAAFAL